MLFKSLGVLLVLLCVGHGAADESFEHKLFQVLSSNYNKHVRPVVNHTRAVDVKIGLSIISFEDLDERKQLLTTHLWLKQFWKDEHLVWNTSDYGDLGSIRIPVDQIWTPDIAVYNGVGDSGGILQLSSGSALPVIQNTGDVILIPAVRIQTFCPLDLTKFPYDEHTCVIKMGSWTYDRSLLKLGVSYEHENGEASFEYNGDKTNLAWDVTHSNVSMNHVQYPCCEETYSDVTMTFTLKRRPGYLNHVFVGPAVIIAFIVPVVFLLPVQSGEKITLGCGIMISQILLLTMLEEFLPTAHPQAPVLGLYYLANIILIGFALVFSAIVTNIWHRSERSGSVPAIFRMLFLGALGRLLCVRKEDYIPVEDHDVTTSPRRLDMFAGEDTGETNANDDKAQIMRDRHRVTVTSEWRQFAAVIDRLLFTVYIIILLFVTISLLS